MSADRIVLTPVFALLALLTASAQWPFGGFPKMRMQPRNMEVSGPVACTASLVPAQLVIGQPAHILLELEMGKSVGLEDVNASGLPDPVDGNIVYGEGFENLADRASSNPSNTIKRLRLPVRFLSERDEDVRLRVGGQVVVRRQSGNMSFTSSQSFGMVTPTFKIKVAPLPQAGRTDDFCGAVGTKFRLDQRLVPEKVHPGDLVTATYTLEYDGWCPSNVLPRIEHLAVDFKAYEPKEVERNEGMVKWTQILVPRTPAATNSAMTSICYYNVHTRRYERVTAPRRKLTFVSSEAASTQNTSVIVDSGTSAKPVASGTVTLRFGPSDKSPVVAVLPPDTPLTELARERGWRRVSTPRAIGWTN